MSKLNNNTPCMPADPNLIFSTDDTTMYVYEGIEEKQCKWRIVNTNAYKNKGLMSVYEINENSAKLKGMRIKMTTTHGGSGISGPICITVSGLDDTELLFSDDELIRRRGIFVIKVQGLTVAGAINPLDSGHGYIVFMRSSKGKEYSADEARTEYYRKNI